MRTKKLFKLLGKNTLAIIIGAVAGFIGAMLYLFAIWVPTEGVKIGLAIIALIPVMIILLGLVGAVLGGVSGMIIYNAVRIFRKKKKKVKV